mgnify:CR=1 FL=1|tara:strand:+ start:175 stop:1329 length:1155 start_codon:yes stop_codon:yes gene_type:complete
MFKNCSVFCVILVFTLSSWVNAVEVKDLYQAKVLVTSQDSSQRSSALKKTMQTVLVKVGGEKFVLSNALIQKALKNPRLYVSQFSYSRAETKTLPIEAVPANNSESLFLIASFDENKINQLLQKARLPLWGRLRPKVLFWLVEEDFFSRQILSESSHSNAPSLVLSLAEKRGLPVIIPLMDFTDATQIVIPDLWGKFSTPIMAASERYGADAVVVIRISNSSLLKDIEVKGDCRPLCDTLNNPQQYVLDWSLLGAQVNKSSEKNYQGSDSESLLTNAFSDITDVIYQGYALSEYANDELIIDVTNIESMNEYIALTNFLLDLSVVNSVVLLSADGSNRRFKLDLLGSKQTLLLSLKLDNQLEQYSDPFAKDSANTVPVFYWGKP